MFKKLFQLFKAFVIVAVVILSTTFGWKPLAQHSLDLSQNQIASAQRLKAAVHAIAGEIGNRNYQAYENLNTAAGFISKAFQDLGYEVEEQSYQVNKQVFRNIIAKFHREKKSDEVVIIGAHYDSCSNPGADDNASAIAGLLEIARLIKDKDLKQNVIFVTFVNEEPPFFQTPYMGSRIYASELKRSGVKIKAAIVLEMIGYYSEEWSSQRYLPIIGIFYPNRGNFVAIVGNFRSYKIVSKVTTGFKQATNFPVESIVAPDFIPGLNFSDHWSFWKEGFPAVMVTDTAYMRNKNYHRQSDLPQTLNYEKMAVVVHALAESIVKIANQ